jgi:hypothetical protein
MATQYFVAGASKTPKATIKVEPSGMSCSAELWLSTDAATIKESVCPG